MKKKGANLGIWLIVLLVMGTHLVMSSLTPLFADDFAYSYSFADGLESEMRDTVITDFASLVQSQIGHYNCMNGRVFAHTLAQLFLMAPKTLFNVVNSVMFVLLGWLICFHAVGNCRSIKAIELLFTYTALLFLAPAFGQSYLWLTAACNYLFTFVTVLLFLIPYRVKWFNRTKGNLLLSLPAAIPMLAFGVIAGNTNENIGVCLIVVLLLYIVTYALFNRNIKLWMVTGWLGTVVGCVISIVAPGNMGRTGGAPIKFVASTVLKCTISYSFASIEKFSPLLLGLVFMLGIILLIKSRKKELSKKGWISLLRDHFFLCFYGVFFLGSVYAMTVPAQFPDRAWAHSLALLIIVFLMVSRKFIPLLALKKNEHRFFVFGSAMLLSVALCLGYCQAIPQLRALNTTHNYRVSLIQEAKANNQNEVAVPSITTASRYSCPDYMGDISDDPDFWLNKGMAQYYGIDRIYRSEDIFI